MAEVSGAYVHGRYEKLIEVFSPNVQRQSFCLVSGVTDEHDCLDKSTF